MKHFFFLSAALLCSAVSILAARIEVDGVSYELYKGDKTGYVTFSQDVEGNVVVKSTVEHEGIEYAINKVEYRAFAENEIVTSVTLLSSITMIMSNAFENCTALESVVISEGLTLIGNLAFYGLLLSAKLSCQARLLLLKIMRSNIVV